MREEKKERTNSHYSQGKIECKDVIEQLTEEHQNDLYVDLQRYSAFKYLWRVGKKDDVRQDLKKARDFIDFAIDYIDRKDGRK